MNDNKVISFPEKAAMTGITLSFTLNHHVSLQASVEAQIRLNSFAEAVAKLAKEGFPDLKHTVVSRQEYKT